VTLSPIPAFEIVFYPSLSVNNNVTTQYQPFLFATSSEVTVLASIVLRDSAHIRSATASAAVSINQVRAPRGC